MRRVNQERRRTLLPQAEAPWLPPLTTLSAWQRLADEGEVRALANRLDGALKRVGRHGPDAEVLVLNATGVRNGLLATSDFTTSMTAGGGGAVRLDVKIVTDRASRPARMAPSWEAFRHLAERPRIITLGPSARPVGPPLWNAHPVSLAPWHRRQAPGYAVTAALVVSSMPGGWLPGPAGQDDAPCWIRDLTNLLQGHKHGAGDQHLAAL